LTTLASVSERLNSLFPSSHPLHQAARYALFPPGKSLRPRLLIEIASIYGVSDSTDPACAVELLHTYSLIHDDLPCMDNDPIRRGKPSLHIAYPEWLALLTGNLLLNGALSLLAPYPKLLPILAQASADLLEGQTADLLSPTSFEEWIAMARLKTGKLFRASAEMGSSLGNAPNVKIWGNWGEDFGLLFQLMDDESDGDAPFSAALLKSAIESLRETLLATLPHPSLLNLLQEWLCPPCNQR